MFSSVYTYYSSHIGGSTSTVDRWRAGRRSRVRAATPDAGPFGAFTVCHYTIRHVGLIQKLGTCVYLQRLARSLMYSASAGR